MQPAGMRLLATIVAAIATAIGKAAIDTFDEVPVGRPPSGGTCGVPGGGSPNWAVEADASAPAPPKVLKQSGAGTCARRGRRGVAIAERYVEARFKPIAGREDQTGGLVWRFKDGDNYYVARERTRQQRFALPHRAGPADGHQVRRRAGRAKAVAPPARRFRESAYQGGPRREGLYRRSGRPLRRTRMRRGVDEGRQHDRLR